MAFTNIWWVQVDGSTGKECTCNAGNTGEVGLIPGSGRSPGEGNGNPLQYSHLKNPMGRGAWWTTVQRVAKSWTWWSIYAYICNWMDRSRKVSFARQELWSATLIIWFFLLVNPTFFLWSTWDGRFPDSSIDKESTCNAGGPSLISGLGRSTEEGVSYLLNILGLPCWLSW